MEDLASAVVDQLRTGDGPAKHWLLCCIHEGTWSNTFYAGLASPGPAADYTLTSCFAHAAKKSSK